MSIYNQASRSFEFRPGAVFANIVIGDEINRASAKTQSALLECMEEHQVTVDGTSYRLDEPFMVVATQNPIEMEGTYPLPEAQRDRFMARISMGYPDKDAEMEMLETHQATSPLAKVTAVVTAGEVASMIATVRQVYVSQSIKEYTVSLGRATRESGMLRLGASPRSMLQLLRAAKATAALDGRDFVLPDDVVSVAESVLAHRIILDRKAASAGETAQSVVRAVLAKIPVSPDLARPPRCRTAARGGPAVALTDRFPRHIFTTRGWGLLGAGAVFLLAAQVMGRRDLLALAILLFVLPVLSLAGTRVLKPNFSVYREFSPASVETGATTTVRLAVARTGTGSGHALMEERLPARFGESPVFRFPARSAAGGTSRYEYHLRSGKRGQFLIGPVTAEFSDPFGLSLHRHAIDDGDILTVTPAAVELPVTGLAGARGHDGVTATRIRANPSDDDVMTREYRHGDPMRRVHWAATARHGELMVRQEESVTTPEATIILDQRFAAFTRGAFSAGGTDHRGAARRGRPRAHHQRHLRVGRDGRDVHRRPSWRSATTRCASSTPPASPRSSIRRPPPSRRPRSTSARPGCSPSPRAWQRSSSPGPTTTAGTPGMPAPPGRAAATPQGRRPARSRSTTG